MGSLKSVAHAESIQCRGITCDEYPEPEVVEDDVPLVQPQLSHTAELSRTKIGNHWELFVHLLDNNTTIAGREDRVQPAETAAIRAGMM